MAVVKLQTLVDYLDRQLETFEIEDWPGAKNGLQVQNKGNVSRLAAAVDATLATAKMAVAAGADLLIVHHGLFWGKTTPWTGKRYELLRCLLDHDLAVYASHLPLDMHRRWGNNAQLCAALGFKEGRPFFPLKDRPAGVRVTTSLSRAKLAERLTRVLGREPTLLPGGPAQCRKIGIVSGGAGAELAQAAAEGVDTFITGEGPHWTHALAEEYEINVFYGGHYATETFGVKALAGHLSKKYGLPWVFLDHPTGL